MMEEQTLQSTNGLVMALKIRDEERRQQAIFRLDNLSAERPTPTTFEFNTADWDEGLWQDEIDWFTELLDGTRDSIVVWRFDNASYTRFTIGNGA